MLRNLTFIICTFFWFISSAQTDVGNTTERITDFHSEITIDRTGLVKVTEHIKIYSNSERILHGIIRSIPLYREDISGTRKKADFKIVSVLKDGRETAYSTKETEQKRNIYIGEADEYLKPGIIYYVISYESRGQVGFFNGYDELYWNVTGNEWDFNIEHASSRITFPEDAKPGNLSCYTGVRGSKENNCNSKVNPDRSVTFNLKGGLKKGEGFTVAAAFTPNVIQRPGMLERIYQDYFVVAASLILVLLFGYGYYKVWAKYGKDPVRPAIIPTFQIPKDWSPAMLRYFDKKYYDHKGVAAAVINLAVNKLITITDDDKNTYKFQKCHGNIAQVSEEEQALYHGLFKAENEITTIPKNGSILEKARAAFREKMTKNLKLSSYYSRNLKPAIWTGVVTVIIMGVFMAVTGNPGAISLVFLVPFFIIGVFLLIECIKSFKTSILTSFILLPFSLMFTGVPLVAGYAYIRDLPAIVSCTVLAILTMYIVLLCIIKSYSKEGIEIDCKIAGFKLYLKTAEEHRLQHLHPPEHTQATFEKFLPYAIALDLENEWGAKFEEMLTSVSYDPEWYDGNQTPGQRFMTAIPSSFYSAVTVSPARSSSGSSSGSSGSSSWSSGSSGSGSSGGGGGGGGGSGW